MYSKETHVNAAKLRSIIIAYLNGQTVPQSIAEIKAGFAALNLQDVKFTDPALTYQLRVLDNNKLISCTKSGNKLMYSRYKPKPETEVLTPFESPAPKPTTVPESDTITAMVQIDIVKATNRLRLLFNGVVIEIGVV